MFVASEAWQADIAVIRVEHAVLRLRENLSLLLARERSPCRARSLPGASAEWVEQRLAAMRE